MYMYMYVQTHSGMQKSRHKCLLLEGKRHDFDFRQTQVLLCKRGFQLEPSHRKGKLTQSKHLGTLYGVLCIHSFS